MYSSWSSQESNNPKRVRGIMNEKGLKGLIIMMMIMLSMTLFLVLKLEDRSLSFFAPHMSSFLHPKPFPARLLPFSLDDGGKHRLKRVPKTNMSGLALRKELQGCLR